MILSHVERDARYRACDACVDSGDIVDIVSCVDSGAMSDIAGVPRACTADVTQHVVQT
jgi:hypothetical protein